MLCSPSEGSAQTQWHAKPPAWSNEAHYFFFLLFPCVSLHLLVKMPFPEDKMNQALVKSLLLWSRNPIPCMGPAIAPPLCRPGTVLSGGGPDSWRHPPSRPGAYGTEKLQTTPVLHRVLASLTGLALLPCSQLLPQISKLYNRDESGCLQKQLEARSGSQPNWLHYRPWLC